MVEFYNTLLIILEYVKTNKSAITLFNLKIIKKIYIYYKNIN